MEKEEKRVVRCVYKGETDADGLPHGVGVMRYVVEPHDNEEFREKGDLRYKGEFCHGVRQGNGSFHGLGLDYNPVKEWEWYQEGQYDGCGRLIRPAHADVTYQRYVYCWYPYFEGTWQDDMPLKSKWDKPLANIDKAEMDYIRQTTMEAVKELPHQTEGSL